MNPKGLLTSYSYDVENRQTGMSYQNTDEDGRLVTVTTSQEYDSMGNVTAVTNERGLKTFFGYDNRRNLIRTTYPDGGTETREYDLGGRVIAVASPNQYSSGSYTLQRKHTRYTYDGMDRVLKVELDTMLNNTGAYCGCVYGVRRYLDNGQYTLINTESCRCTYEIRCRACSRNSYNNDRECVCPNCFCNKPSGNVRSSTIVETNTYDYNGNLLTRKDALNTTTSYEYDAANRLKKTTHPASIGTFNCTEYNAIGRITVLSTMH